jgi:hypothetical protein
METAKFQLISLHTNYPVSLCYFLRCNRPNRPRPSRYRSCKITLRHTTVGRTPLDEWSALRRDLFLTTYKIHNRKILSTVWDSKPQPWQARRRTPTPPPPPSCGAGRNPAYRTSAVEAVCTLTPVLVPPFISRGAVRQTVWETSTSERRNCGREIAGQI